MGRGALLGTIAVGAALALFAGERAWAQRTRPAGKRTQISTRPIQPADDAAADPRDDVEEQDAVQPAAHEQPAAKVKSRSASGALPNDHGQVWREYDLTPYVTRVTDYPHPEQAVIDWILRETGYESWHSEPLAILSASPDTLRVYHTPQMQATVADIVERFVNADEADHAVGMRIVAVGAAHWRSRMPARLTPVEVQSPGMQAWLMAREEAGVLLAELGKRNDFREYGSPRQLFMNGQTTVISTMRSRNYTQHLLPGVVGGATFEPHVGAIEEGISVELTPLVARDGASIDAIVRCNIDQVERIVPVAIESNLAKIGRERSKVEIPQRVQLRVKETFRWNVDQVLVVSLGVAPVPDLTEENLLEKALPLPLPTSPPRAEILLMIESRGHQKATSTTTPAAAQPSNGHGRY